MHADIEQSQGDICQVDRSNAWHRHAFGLARKAYKDFVGHGSSDDIHLGQFLLEPFKADLKAMSEDEFHQFLQENDFLAGRIRERAPLSVLFRNASVLLVYWLAQKIPDRLAQDWPADRIHLRMPFTDLGISGEGRI